MTKLELYNEVGSYLRDYEKVEELTLDDRVALLDDAVDLFYKIKKHIEKEHPLTYYIVVVEDQAECYEEHTAQISEIAYDNLDDAKRELQNCINDIETNTEWSWVARSLTDYVVSVRKKTISNRWTEYIDMYSSNRMYAYIQEIKAQQ